MTSVHSLLGHQADTMKHPIRYASALALFGAAGVSHALTLNDSFAVDQTGVTRTTVGTSTSTGVSLGAGLTRYLINTQNANSTPGLGESSVFVSGGAFSFSNFPTVASNYAIDYVYSAPMDFSGLAGFQVDFRANDLSYNLFVDVTDTFGVVSTFVANVRAGSAFTVLASGIGGTANLSRVARISIQSDGTQAGVDSSITGIRSVQAVPEPASIVALGLGAVGILRRRKKA